MRLATAPGCTRRPVFRQGTQECKPEGLLPEKRAFVSSRRFTVIKGQEFWINDEVCFPVGHPDRLYDCMSPDGFYRTVFGPSVPHNGITFCKCNGCEKIALRRVTCVRKPILGDAAFDHETSYRKRQREFINLGETRTVLNDWLNTGDLEDYVDIYIAVTEHAGDPHPKRDLRVQARKDLETGNARNGGLQNRLWLKTVLYKLKTEEFGKNGKLPRMIGDLGVAASLQGFKITELVKHMMCAKGLQAHGMTCQVIMDPRPETLVSVFEKLIDPPGRGYFALYSDDSCLSIRLNGQVRMFNLDIAACDTSHTEELFTLLRDTAPEIIRNDIQVLIDQCKLPIELRDRNNSRNKVVLQPNEATLYSGSTLTTIINNLANVLIFLSIAESMIRTTDDIRTAAARAGYVITGTSPEEECSSYHKIQFLKHSPVYDTTGRLRALKNPGVFLRSMGNSKRDLPGRGNILARARSFNKGFIQGTYPNTRITFVEHLRRRFAAATVDTDMEKYVQEHLSHHPQTSSTPTDEWTVDDHEWAQRYGLEDHEVHELNELFARADVEDSISCSAINKVLNADYGLSCLT